MYTQSCVYFVFVGIVAFFNIKLCISNYLCECLVHLSCDEVFLLSPRVSFPKCTATRQITKDYSNSVEKIPHFFLKC